MFTRNGRFKQNVRLCLSMSDYHPESWNPMWSVASILSGLMSFMLDSQSTLGSMEASDEQRRQYARESLQENARNPVFRRLFPQYVKLAEERMKAGATRERESSIGVLAQENGSELNLGNGEEEALIGGNHAENIQVELPRRPWRQVAVGLGTVFVTAIAIVWGVLINKHEIDRGQPNTT